MNALFPRRRLRSLLRRPDQAACSTPTRRCLPTVTRAIFLGLLLCAPAGFGQTTAPQQQPGTIRGVVVDATGNPVPGAQITSGSGDLLATSSPDGTFTLPAGTGTVAIQASHFAPASVTVAGQMTLRIQLEQPFENVTVTAYRSPLSSLDSPASTRVMTAEALRHAASLPLDDKLRTVPGFELFRRSSSLVANPTSQGVSLRGLGSTSASRSLVVFDEVPLNDPYGGWIHWEELPQLDIQSVEVVRGGASDLYGSSAIGGVISVEPFRPKNSTLRFTSSGGSESTVDGALLGSLTLGKWSGLATGGAVATDGYILTAPAYRGPIDQPSNVHAQNALVQIDRDLENSQRLFLRGNVLNEDRHNGTPIQNNGTRLWRYDGGADLTDFLVRIYGTSEHYRQRFTSINATRTAETLTTSAEEPSEELGVAGHWHHAVATNLLLLAGADTHYIRAASYQTIYTGKGGVSNTAAKQVQTGVYGEVLYTPKNWTFSGSARIDHFANYDVNQFATATGPSNPPSFSQTPFDPRLGVTRRITQSLALSASGFRAFRSPNEDELYAKTQVGSQVTLPNPNLRSERATGWETGLQADLHRFGSSVRVSYFFTQVNRPITTLTVSTTPTSQTLMRANLGQIESRGISLDYSARPARWISVAGGYQFADATVTKFQQQPNLVGNWIPEVARNMATAQVGFTERRLGFLSFQGRISGHQFDDTANSFYINGYFRLDAYAAHEFRHNISLFASGENLFDRGIIVGKTPLPTLGTPRVARFGLRYTFRG
jgi:outer membrane receptor protein involved in Fe transport